MTKQVEKTERIVNLIKKSIDDESVDTSNFAVFETKMASTEAVTQKGFYDGSRLTRSTLVEMAEFINDPINNLPLHIMHNNKVLPIGRVFYATLEENDTGESELVGLFYIPQNSEDKSKVVKDIEAGVIDEVSIGLLAKHAYCSECSFDFFGKEADIMNLYTLTCNEDHTIGEDGCHVRLVGVDTFAELSVVNQGASRNPKIRSRAKQSLSKESIERLAANGIPAEAHFFANLSKMNPKDLNNKGDSFMSNGLEAAAFAEVNQKLGKIEAELSQANSTIEGLGSEVESLRASIDEKDAKIAELEAAASTDVDEVTKEKEALTAQLSQVTEFVMEDLKAALVASGDKVVDKDLPNDLTSMLSLVKEKGLKLHQMFSAGVSDQSKQDVDNTDSLALRRARNFKMI